jgi:antitoxin MazE
MKVCKWGNSLAIRLPWQVVEILGLKEGDDIAIDVVEPRGIKASKAPTRKEIVQRLRKFRGWMPPDFKFDRLEANERR